MFADPPSLSTPPSPYEENEYPQPPPFIPSPTPSEDDDLPLPKINFRIENGDIIYNNSPSPSPRIGSGRASLSRSESAPSAIDVPPSTSRQFTRVTSGPVQLSTPAASSIRLPMSSGLSSTARKITGARRVRLDELRETAESKENNDLHPLPTASTSTKPLADVLPVPQRTLSAQGRQVLPVPSRATRLKRPDVITELDEFEEEPEMLDRPRSALAMSTGATRPRRSASMSEANAEEIPFPQFQDRYSRQAVNNRGARRVTMEEKMRQEQEMGFQGLSRESSDEFDELERRAMELVNAHAPPGTSTHESRSSYESRQTPSPPHMHAQPHLRPSYGHQRKDSDTLRTGSPMLSSPTVLNANAQPRGPSPHHRDSTSSRDSSGSNPGSGGRTIYAPQNGLQNGAMQRHRRSPTAPEPPTTSAMIAPPNVPPLGNTWAGVEGRDSFGEKVPGDEYQPAPVNGRESGSSGEVNPRPRQSDKMRPPPVPLRQTQSQPTVQSQAAAFGADGRNRNFVVNKKVYMRLDLLGKGGTSRVYRVMDNSQEMYALKRVSLDRTDPESMNGYMNEIALLKRLDGNNRIIRLIDSEVKAGGGGSKGHLMLVMECGEIDLARLMQERQKEPVDLVWVSSYWKQMLQAVQIIHDEKIVHSDLKPANFVLVKGQLKLIDFGIANAIANDTTNIQRDHQVGTVNYMSPEAIELPDGMRRLKVGRQSDVWSLGCILYQMVYGHPPFQQLSVFQKMKAIPDGSYAIDFPEYSAPLAPRADSSSPPKRLNHLKVPLPSSIIRTMQRCLVRNPKGRATIPELLNENWLTMQEPPPPPSPAPAVLKQDETVINPFFMGQLLKYGVMLGLQGRDFTEEDLEVEALRLVKELQGVHTKSAAEEA